MTDTKAPPAAVLVVDDNELIRDLLVAILAGAGYETVAADSGGDGIEALSRRAGRFSAAIVDLSLPDMSGVQTIDRLRELAPGLPVMLVSAHDEAVAQRAVAARPGVVFLQKPFDARDLVQHLEALVAGPPSGG